MRARRGTFPLMRSSNTSAPNGSCHCADSTRMAMGHPRLSTRKCRLRPQIFFCRVVAFLGTTHRTGFHRLAIENPDGWVGITAGLQPDLTMQGFPDLLPYPLAFPSSEVPIDGFPGGQVVGKQSPGATTAQDIQDRVDDLSALIDGGSSLRVWFWDQWLQDLPLIVPQI